MIVDYLGHSGFLVETDHVLMLFDYYVGDLSLIDEKPEEKPLFVFASHVHADHFQPKIFGLSGHGRKARFLLSDDIRGNAFVPDDADILFLKPDREYEIPELGTVRTLLSTDEGVAFLIKTGNETVYHAGDLNWWDWEGEDPAWLADQERIYKREIGCLSEERIDAAFVVLDDRLENNYAEGMEWFLSACRADYVFPMHFWNDLDLIGRFAAEHETSKTGTKMINTAGDRTHWVLPGKRKEENGHAV